MATDIDEMLAVTEALLRESAADAPARLAPPVPVAPRRTTVTPPAGGGPLTGLRRRRAMAPVTLLVIAILGLPGIAPRVRVRVGREVVSFHSATPTVADVLRRASAVGRDGALLAAVSRRQLVSRYDRAVVTRDGVRVDGDVSIRTGDRLVVHDGTSVVENMVSRVVVVPAPGYPAVEYGLWHAASDGSSLRLVGEQSGEVVGEHPVAPPVPARPVTELAVGLSFDDGPNPTWTPQVLGILRAAGVKATFCIVGYAARRYPHLVKAIADEGHTLCDHTMNHVQLLGRKAPKVITEEVGQGIEAIERASGARPRFFRAPGGTWDSKLVDEVHAQEMRALGWNVDPADFERPGPAVITSRVLAQLRPGAMILLHDGGGDRSQTVAQLPALIERLRALGYTLRVPA